MQDRQVTINMNVNTVNALTGDGYSLYGFKPVQSSSPSGRPLVWSATQSYSTLTLVSWSEQYDAYTSSAPIVSGGQINMGFYAPLQTGQTLNVGANGIGTVVAQGLAAYISIYNTTKTQFTCGIAQATTGTATAPYCAFPLYGLNQESVEPVDGILLIFSNGTFAPGTVIEGSLAGPVVPSNHSLSFLALAVSQGVMVDMAGKSSCSLSYDINQGWKWDPGIQATSVSANADLVPLLIIPPSS